MSQVFMLSAVLLVLFGTEVLPMPQVVHVGPRKSPFSNSIFGETGALGGSGRSTGYASAGLKATHDLTHQISGSNLPEEQLEIEAPMYEQETIDRVIDSFQSRNLTVSHELESLGSDYLNKTKETSEAPEATTMSPEQFQPFPPF